MSELISSSQTILPLPEVGVRIRAGVMSDLPFIDGLQKKTTRQVGWMPTKQLEGKIGAGHVLVAERQFGVESLAFGVEDREEVFATPNSKPQTSNGPVPAGYLIGHDQYFKRDDVGIIYQINVVPEYRRSLVAASLLKAQFERSAYGCRLYCCWCAQDIEANRFWEAMGFVPLAYRVGSMTRGKSEVRRMKDEKEGDDVRASSFSLHTSSFATKARVHIFWQKRIRAGDETTPWWFPAKTDGGAIRADRIVLPIPPGTRWDEEMPILLPGENSTDKKALSTQPSVLSTPSANRKSSCPERGRRGIGNRRSPVRYGAPTMALPVVVEPPKVRVPKPKVKTDPKLIAAARELRDRWLEKVNEDPAAICGHGKYDVSRTLTRPASEESQRARLAA